VRRGRSAGRREVLPDLSSNPLSCLACNLEVPPERIGFSEAFAEKLAFWQSFHDCFYLLWLESGEFESWAKAQLSDPGSPANKRGRELVSELSAFRPAYYWWFQDTGAEESQPLSRCPVCQAELAERHSRQVSDSLKTAAERSVAAAEAVRSAAEPSGRLPRVSDQRRKLPRAPGKLPRALRHRPCRF